MTCLSLPHPIPRRCIHSNLVDAIPVLLASLPSVLPHVAVQHSAQSYVWDTICLPRHLQATAPRHFSRMAAWNAEEHPRCTDLFSCSCVCYRAAFSGHSYGTFVLSRMAQLHRPLIESMVCHLGLIMTLTHATHLHDELCSAVREAVRTRSAMARPDMHDNASI